MDHFFSTALPAGTIGTLIIGALIASVIGGVYAKRIFDAFMTWSLAPFRWLGDRLYRWMAPRNPFSISVRSYRRHLLRSNLARLETPFGANVTVELQRAFAPLKLISHEGDERIELFDYAGGATRAIVLGGPGTGKTTLMKSLVLAALERRVQGEGKAALIPVFIVLRNLAKNQHTVQAAIVKALEDHHFPGSERFVQSTLEAGRFLIVLDGLDEVGTSRGFVAQQIIDFCQFDEQRERRNRLYVTCREHSYRTRDLAGVISDVLHVEPFASHHMRVFLRGWPLHGGRAAIGLYTLIQNDAQVRDICRNPLLLTILTVLYLMTRDFEVPSSRREFYKRALDELMVSRSERRGIVQGFDPALKRRLLERIALERLETAMPGEDTEEFTSAAIARHGSALFGANLDAGALIRELVDINGVLRPSNEDSYTCAHRTIQEYLAACEAARQRSVDEVLKIFAERSDLIEVLYFYCSIIKNLPDLTRVVEALEKQANWLVAGKALASMSEAPSAAMVSRVARQVALMSAGSAETAFALEVLAALASRRDDAFADARHEFDGAIESLASRDDSGGASVLETAISASPDIALKLIPGMLNHESPAWRRTAVQLLADIGSDETLDSLVQLLVSTDTQVRTAAAFALAQLMSTRRDEIGLRATLLPDRVEPRIWPLGRWFPARVIVPMAEAIAASDLAFTSQRPSLSSAVRAAKALKTGDDAEFLRTWKLTGRDASLRAGLRRCMTGLCLLVVSLAAVLLSTGVSPGAGLGHVEVYALTPPWQRVVPRTDLEAFDAATHRVIDHIDATVPPASLGLRRLLPSNWTGHPQLEPDALAAYEIVRNWSKEQVDPTTFAADLASTGALRASAGPAELAVLQATARPLVSATQACDRAACVSHRFSPWTWLRIPAVALYFTAALLWVAKSEVMSDAPAPRLRILGVTLPIARHRLSAPMFWLMACLSLPIGAGASQGVVLLLLIPSGLALALAGCAILLSNLRWPRNPYLAACADFEGAG